MNMPIRRSLRSEVVLGALAVAMLFPAVAAGLDWQQVPGEEVEFGVTATLGGVPVQYPSALETGYNGAWVWGNPADGAIYGGVAQTFTVPSTRVLKGVQLRVGLFDLSIPTGQFEVAIHRFDTLTGCLAEKLASVLANANAYPYPPTLDVPVSTFDLSSFELTLSSGNMYALVVTPTANFTGGNLTLQAALDIYAGGSVYLLAPGPGTCFAPGPGPVVSVPTLSPWLLVGLGAFLLALGIRRRTR